MTADEELRPTGPALDAAIRAHLAPDIDPDGEVITTWLVLAGTRNHHGGGVVITATPGDGIPTWEVEGLLRRGIAMVNRADDEDQE